LTDVVEIRWHGRAGQGAKSAAYTLAESAGRAGKYIQAFPVYGSERAGAPMMAFTRIADKPIRMHEQIYTPDVVVLLDETILESAGVLKGLKPDGIFLMNTPKSPEEIKEKYAKDATFKIFTADGTTISIEEMGRAFPNIPLLGALAKVTGLVPLERLSEDVYQMFAAKRGEKVAEANQHALKRGYEEVKGL